MVKEVTTTRFSNGTGEPLTIQKADFKRSVLWMSSL